jgi:hypothetical protein
MKTIASLITCILTCLAAALYAQPAYLNYQGRLSDAAGAPLGNGSYTLEFNIYDGPNGGTKVWGPFLLDGNTGNGHAPQAVVLQGRFNVILGAEDTAARPLQDAVGGTNRFVEIKVDGGAPIVPRQQFLSSPYAFRSFRAYDADRAASATMAASVTDGNVALLNRSPQTFSGQNTFSGTVGIGTTADPAARLKVQGDIKLGPSAQHFAPSAAENLHVVRGVVRGNTSAGLNKGTGYTVNNFVGGQGQPETTVAFSQAFTDLPTVTLTMENAPEAWHVSVINVTTTNFNVRMWRSDSVRHNAHFHFTAIGPR